MQAGVAWAHTPQEEAAWASHVQQMALQAARATLGDRTDVRIEVQVGRLDERLSLAPCAQVDYFLPPNQKAWGPSRVGLRCLEGPKRWSVFLPLTVHVFAPGLQTSQALAAGTVLSAQHLQLAQTDWAAAPTPPFNQPQALLGRTLSRAVPAGATLREADLKRRQWFATGDPVRIVARGAGFSVTADGVALTPGIEGQTARVRTEGGRTLTGMATADRKFEVTM